jgi:putative transposase
MARQPRIHFPGAVFHVISRGNGKMPIYHDDNDRSRFMDMLGEIKSSRSFKLYAYCLMPNHLHMLIEVGQFSISAIMHQLLTRYSSYFNWRHSHVGHVFQGRFKGLLCKKDSHVVELMRYIHLNPVRAGLVASPDAWRWSGYREMCGKAPNGLLNLKFPLAYFGADKSVAMESYRDFVSGRESSHGGQWRSSIGELVEEKANRTLHEVALEASKKSRIPLELLRSPSRSRSISEGRWVLISEALGEGIAPSEVASYLRLSPSAITKAIARGIERMSRKSDKSKPDPTHKAPEMLIPVS